MKKILIVLFVLPLLFACSDDEETTQKDALSLSAWEFKKRVWTADITVHLMFGYQKGVMSIIRHFDSDAGSKFDTTTTKKGKYVYRHPKITFTSNSGDVHVFTVNEAITEIKDEDGNVYEKWSK